jgi:hypothetical protein
MANQAYLIQAMLLLLLLEQGFKSLEALNIYQGAGRIGDGIGVGLLRLNGVSFSVDPSAIAITTCLKVRICTFSTSALYTDFQAKQTILALRSSLLTIGRPCFFE